MTAIRTPLEKLQRRLNRLKALLKQRASIAKTAIDEITVEEIKTKMFAADYSIRIIDNVEIRDVRITKNKIKYTIFNELLVGDGFDIAEGREGGIPPHDIFGNPTLAWQGRTIIGTPTTIFAAHVKHPGLEASWIIKDTVQEKQFAVEQRYRLLLNNKIQEIKNSS